MKLLQEIAEAIEEQEKIHLIGQITYSSVGITSAGLTIGGIIAAPFTMGASLGLTIAGIATGVTSGAAALSHIAVKEGLIRKKSKVARGLLEEDERLYVVMKEKLDELNNLTAGASNIVDDEGISLGGALVVGRSAGAFGRTACSIVDIAADFAKLGGKVLGPITGVFAVVDAVTIGYNAKKLHKGEFSETAKKLREYVEKLEEGLKETKKLLEDNHPPSELTQSLSVSDLSLPFESGEDKGTIPQDLTPESEILYKS